MSVVWDDLLSDTASARSGGTAPALSKVADNAAGTSTGVYANLFSDATKEVHIIVQVPHKWAHGTNIKPHVHWFPTTEISNGETVVFNLEYLWTNVGDVLPTDTTEDQVTYTSSGATPAKTHKMTNLTAIAGTGMGVSSILLCRVGGDATSTFAGDIFIIGIDFHIQIDGLGSLNEASKP